MTFFRYAIIQMLAYVVDMGIFMLGMYMGLLGTLLSNVVAKLFAGGFAFVAHRKFTFEFTERGKVKKQAVKYFLLLSLNIPISSLILALTLLWVSNPIVAKFISDVIGVILTYFISKHYVFNMSSNISNARKN